MKRKLSVILCALVLLISGCGVSESLSSFFKGGDFGSFSDNASKNDEEQTLYNGYTDIAVTLLTGYYVTELNSVNLTESKGGSSNLFTLERNAYGDGGSYLILATIESHVDSTDNDHCSIELYLEEYDFLSQEDYFIDFADSLEYEDNGGYYSTVIDNSIEKLDGVEFFRFITEVTYPGYDDVIYNEEYYIVPVGSPEDGLYFIAAIDYWQDSKKSQSNANYLLEHCFQLGNTLPLTVSGGSGAIV